MLDRLGMRCPTFASPAMAGSAALWLASGWSSANRWASIPLSRCFSLAWCTASITASRGTDVGACLCCPGSWIAASDPDWLKSFCTENTVWYSDANPSWWMPLVANAVARVCGRFGYYSAHASSGSPRPCLLGFHPQDRYRYLPFILLPPAAAPHGRSAIGCNESAQGACPAGCHHRAAFAEAFWGG